MGETEVFLLAVFFASLALALVKDKRFAYLALLAVIALSANSHMLVYKNNHMPTFGNTFIHVATERHFVQNGFYPLDRDYSYAGLAPNSYVPFYRSAIAVTSSLLSVDVEEVSRAFVMLFALLLPIGFFLLGRKLFVEIAGAVAALSIVLMPETLIYTVRPLPQAMGLVLLPFAFYLILEKKLWPSILMTVIVSLVHQEAAVFLAGAALFYSLGLNLSAMLRERKIVLRKESLLPFYCFAAAAGAYLLWHYAVVGNFNIFGLAQFKYHEGAKAGLELIITKTGLLPVVLGLIGFAACAFSWLKNFLDEKTSRIVLVVFSALAAYAVIVIEAVKFDAVLGAALAALAALAISFVRIELSLEKSAFALFVFIAAVGAVKNDVVGVNVFMDRFIVYLQQPIAVLAGLAAALAARGKIVFGGRK
ncbi:hypothetical protein HY993_01045 [Candidatus Micrarchaeota archaeon]|nr:hypothetical protein [Candidatus Micrarchaeota archaeon]